MSYLIQNMDNTKIKPDYVVGIDRLDPDLIKLGPMIKCPNGGFIFDVSYEKQPLQVQMSLTNDQKVESTIYWTL